MTQEFDAAFCNADLDPYIADKVIKDRFDILKQQLQLGINDECQFDSKCPSLRHNLSPSCKSKTGTWHNVCACGASDHVMTNKHCPNHHVDDEKCFLKIKSMNLYHAKRVNKASKFDRWKQFNALYPNNTLTKQPSINNQKDDADGNGYYNKQRR